MVRFVRRGSALLVEASDRLLRSSHAARLASLISPAASASMRTVASASVASNRQPFSSRNRTATLRRRVWRAGPRPAWTERFPFVQGGTPPIAVSTVSCHALRDLEVGAITKESERRPNLYPWATRLQTATIAACSKPASTAVEESTSAQQQDDDNDYEERGCIHCV